MVKVLKCAVLEIGDQPRPLKEGMDPKKSGCSFVIVFLLHILILGTSWRVQRNVINLCVTVPEF